jgi:hypothetical protein
MRIIKPHEMRIIFSITFIRVFCFLLLIEIVSFLYINNYKNSIDFLLTQLENTINRGL